MDISGLASLLGLKITSYVFYNNDFTSIIDIYFYETFSTLTQNN
jgi:hypothetical protein